MTQTTLFTRSELESWDLYKVEKYAHWMSLNTFSISSKSIDDEQYKELLIDAIEERQNAFKASRPTSSTKVQRNAPCTCGSGRKYKHCCGRKND